jgi:hypothetical protein
MNKINFHFNLLQARFPELYHEAEDKITGGVRRADILADWLNELVCLRNSISNHAPVEKTTTTAETTDFAKSVMDNLLD